MKTVNFLFGVHNHQPVGNFDYVFEEAFQKSYKPFIDVLERYPSIAMSLHFSGCLLEWLEEHHPDYLDRIRGLVERGNIEIMSGGFYEPIIAVIPDDDKHGQIQKMNQYIRDRFHYDPEGLWLTERVWEPHLAKPFNEAGIKYITVDDAHFISAGKRQRELTGYFHTEEQGKILDIFPIKQKLRYLIPFDDPEKSIELMRQFATEDGSNALVMADDGEKFGVWPGTHKTVYQEKWLERFFNLLVENSDWLKTKTFSDYYHQYPARGRVYLPTGSYFEMGQWTLPAHMGVKFENWVHHLEENGELEEYQPFIKGGIWRNFFAKYDESNWIHKRVLGLSERYHDYVDGGDELPEIRDELWRATCNCAYWHGIFGGLYLPHLRDALYRKLLSAEAQFNQATGAAKGWTKSDVDRDGSDEYIGKSDTVQTFWKPSEGAALVELDFLPSRFNLLNTLKRYEESYHSKVTAAKENAGESGESIHEIFASKEENLDQYLQYDKHLRRSFLDHFFSADVSLEEISRSEYEELGDFIDTQWNVSEEKSDGVVFERLGEVAEIPVHITKNISLKDTEISVIYEIENRGESPLQNIFTPELNFSLLGGESDDRYYTIDGEKPDDFHMASQGKSENIESMEITNEWDGFTVKCTANRQFDLWRYPVYTVSMSEAGFERVYQSSVVLPRFSLDLQPGESDNISISLTLNSTK